MSVVSRRCAVVQCGSDILTGMTAVMTGTSGSVMSRLAFALFKNAQVIGRNLRDGENHGIRQGEEGITERVLLDLAKKIPELRIDSFSHPEECRNGADWEWWLSDGSDRWFHWVVQAKKWRPTPAANKGGNYKIDHIIPSSGDQQIDLLTKYARTTGASAVYVLYHPAARVSYRDHRCCQGPSGDRITAIRAETFTRRFRDTLTGVPLADVRPFALPWSCLTDYRGRGLPAHSRSSRQTRAVQPEQASGLPAGHGPSPSVSRGSEYERVANALAWGLDFPGESDRLDPNSLAHRLFRNFQRLAISDSGREWIDDQLLRGYPSDWLVEWLQDPQGGVESLLQQGIPSLRVYDGDELPDYVTALRYGDRLHPDLRHPLADADAAPKHIIVLDEGKLPGQRDT